MQTLFDFSIIIPIYNESENIEILFKEIENNIEYKKFKF